MIVCSCNVFTEKRIVATARELALAEPGRPVTPARIFKALGGHAGDNRHWPDIDAWAARIAQELRAPDRERPPAG